MSYSDWIQSSKSERVWLEDSMTALAQFAYVTPIQRVMHWNNTTRRRTYCYEEKYEKCFMCDKGVQKIYDYTYGLFINAEEKTIKYVSTALSTHKNIQREFRRLFEANVNPCSILWKIRRGKIKTLTGREVNGYDCIPMVQTDDEGIITSVMEAYVAEADRPSPFQEDMDWIVPRIIADGLLDLDSRPMDLIALFIEMKERFPQYDEKELKSYAIRLVDNGAVDLRRAAKRKKDG